jgi:hypothetical protein
MDTPQYINEIISDVRCIKPGWYAMDDFGNLSSDLFPATRNVSGASLSQNTGRCRTTRKQKDQCHDEHHHGT